MKLHRYVFGALLLLVTACSPEQKTFQKYFDFDGLIDDQVSQLSQRMRVLDKAADVSGNKSDSTFLPSEKGWEHELEIFRQLEAINKPAFQKAYRIEDPLRDSRSNLKIRQYAAAAAPIPLVRFYYQEEFVHLKRIEAEIMQSNTLYTNRRTLVMEFDEEDNKPLLIRYSIEGFQKMILSDSVPFSVIGQIDW